MTDVPAATSNRYGRAALVHVACFIALGLPFLIGYGFLPLTNLVGEALGLVGLALMLVVISLQMPMAATPAFRWPAGWLAPLPMAMSAVALLAIAALTQFVVFGMHHADAYLVVAGYFACAGAAIWLGHTVARSDEAGLWLRASVRAVVLAALLAAMGSVAQYFSLNGNWVMLSYVNDAGRTYGFVRQPNQQATFLCMGLLALFVLHRMGGVRAAVWLAGSALLVFALITTGSRTGLLQLLFVTLWSGWFMLTQQQGRRSLLLAVWPLALGAAIWLALYLASQSGGLSFYGAAKLTQTSTEGMGLRAVLWQQTLSMIAERPWLGQGVLHFPSQFFLGGHALKTGVMMSNAHNLFLQLAFDYGVPLTLMVTALLGAVLWRGRRLRTSLSGFMAFGMLGCVLVHSMLEFPLWYAYFLLPAGYWLGWLTHSPTTAPAPELVKPQASGLNGWRPAPPLAAGLAMILVAVSMNRDFFLLTPVYTPGPRVNLQERLDEANRAFWFQKFARFPGLQVGLVTEANHADYLAHASVMGCIMFEPWHQTGMIVAWAHAGRLDEAKWVLYQFWRLGRGKTEQFRNALKSSNAVGAPELLHFLENPQPVPPRRDSFEQACL